MRISKEAGWVEIALRWAHDSKRVLDLPDEFTEPEPEDCLEKEANEFLVCLLRGKNLPVMDKNVLSVERRVNDSVEIEFRAPHAIDATLDP